MFRPIRREVLVLAACLIAPLTAACSDSNTTSSGTTTPSPVAVTDTFTGALNPNGAQQFPFAVPTAGTVIATLTNVGPDAASIVGFALGTWNGAACQLVLTNDKATKSTVIQGTVSGAGNLCVRVYDVGNLTSAQSFQIDVAHP